MLGLLGLAGIGADAEVFITTSSNDSLATGPKRLEPLAYFLTLYQCQWRSDIFFKKRSWNNSCQSVSYCLQWRVRSPGLGVVTGSLLRTVPANGVQGFWLFGFWISLKLNSGRATNGALQFFGSLFFNVYLSILWFYYIEWYWRKCINIVKWKNKDMYSLVYFDTTSIFAQKRLKVYMWNAHLIKFNSDTWFCAQE